MWTGLSSIALPLFRLLHYFIGQKERSTYEHKYTTFMTLFYGKLIECWCLLRQTNTRFEWYDPNIGRANMKEKTSWRKYVFEMRLPFRLFHNRKRNGKRSINWLGFIESNLLLVFGSNDPQWMRWRTFKLSLMLYKTLYGMNEENCLWLRNDPCAHARIENNNGDGDDDADDDGLWNRFVS